MLHQPGARVAQTFCVLNVFTIFVIAQRGLGHDFARHGLRTAKQSKLHSGHPLTLALFGRTHGVVVTGEFGHHLFGELLQRL